MASAVGTQTLQNTILLLAYRDQPDEAIDAFLLVWLSLSEANEPTGPSAYIQKAWDGIVRREVAAELLNRGTTQVDKARLLVATDEGDWRLAPPITPVDLKVDDETIRVAVGHPLGANTHEPHTCICGKNVSARGLRGLACRNSMSRPYSHDVLNFKLSMTPMTLSSCHNDVTKLIDDIIILW